MVRRGADLVLESVWDLANAESCWRDRVLPLSGDEEAMVLLVPDSRSMEQVCENPIE